MADASVRYRIDVKSDAVVKATRRTKRELAAQRAQVRRTKRAWDDLNRGIGSFASKLGSLRGVASVALGGGVLGGLIKSASGAGAALVELSAGVGGTTEEVQKLTQAFESDGISGEKAIEVFRRLNRGAVSAQRGIATFQRAFNDLGIDVDRFINLSLTEKLLEINRGASGLGVAARTEALANLQIRDARVVGLFGQQGRLESNLRGVEDLARISGEAAANLKALDQAIYDLTNDAVKTLQEAVGDATPALIEFTEKLREQVPKLETAFEFAVDNLGEILRTAGFAVAGGAAIRGVQGGFRGAAAAANLLGRSGAAAALTSYAGPVSLVLTGAVAMTVLGRFSQIANNQRARGRADEFAANATIAEILLEVERAREARLTTGRVGAGVGIGARAGVTDAPDSPYVQALLAAVGEREGAAESARRAAFEAAEAAREEAAEERKLADARKAQAAATALAEEREKRLKDIRASIADESAQMRAEADRRALVEGITPFDTSWQPGSREIASLVAGTRAVFGDTPERVSEQERLWRAYRDTGDAGRALIDTAQGLGYSLQSLISDLRDTSDETRTAGDKIKSALGGLVDTFFARFLDSQANRLSDFLLKFLPGFAGGGYAGPGLFVAGETGPELIASRRPVYVHNPAETREMMREGIGGGGSSITVNLRVQALDAEGIDRAGRLLQERVSSAVERSLARDRHIIRGRA